MKLLTVAAMRELERRAMDELGLSGAVLMENAGRGVADLICARYGATFPGPVLVLAGQGNNGGDGYVIARHLRNRGWQVTTLVLAEEDAVRGDAGINLAILKKSGAPLRFASDRATLNLEHAVVPRLGLVVDALFGTGLNAAVSGFQSAAIHWVNGCGAPVVAVDIPSGVDAGSGRLLGPAVRADLTATFAYPKLGHVLHPGAGLLGELVLVDIGIPAAFSAACVKDALVLVDAAVAAELLPSRPIAGHKGTFGHLLVVAGSCGKAGAAALAAAGGLRSGAGLVTVATPAAAHPSLAAQLTEAMSEPLPEADGALAASALARIETLLTGKTAVALGPGLGLAEPTTNLVRRLVESLPLPLVLDADGLGALAGDLAPLGKRRAGNTILTPHPGEMARLCGLSIAEIEADRVGIARDFAARQRVVLVLKGARTVIAAPDGRIFINGSGNSGLAAGGMGDVLTGLIGGLLAQGLTTQDAAVLGVYLHGAAADRLRDRMGDAGLTAGDLARELPLARRALSGI